MKKSILLSLALMCSTFAFAQTKGDMAVGGNIGGGVAYSGGYSNFGLGAKFQYNITDPVRVEAEENYWIKNDGTSMFDLCASVHYIFNIANDWNVYPLAGFGLYTSHVDLGPWGSSNDALFGGRIGAGIEYKLLDNISVDFELKYHFMAHSMSHLTLQAGVAYKF